MMRKDGISLGRKKGNKHDPYLFREVKGRTGPSTLLVNLTLNVCKVVKKVDFYWERRGGEVRGGEVCSKVIQNKNKFLSH